MASNFYLGVDPQDRLGDTPRFFYGLRKNENGSLFLQRVDNLKSNDSVQINRIGDEAENYNDFTVGVDFFEGVDVNHNQVYDNLRYQQYRWDDRAIIYYIDEEGQLVAKINAGHTYDNGASEE